MTTWLEFWNKTYDERKAAMWSLLNRSPTALQNSNRNWYVTYHLLNEDGKKEKVCKTFFLATLGYPKTSSVIQTLLKTPSVQILPNPDKRGKATPHNALSADTNDAIQKHIRSYNPCISHYRREHAPNRLYLPCEITETAMHANYNSKHPTKTCSYETYCRHVVKMNISFVKLGAEQCEICTQLSLAEHTKINGECTAECQTCLKKSDHRTKYIEARQEYETDGEAVRPGHMVRSTDLQKVIMLPRLPGVKTVCFTKRIIAFHETFAPINSYLKVSPNLCVVWHEGLAGRRCEEITSVYMKCIERDRDFEHIIYFMDNCAAQNKNWSLITAAVRIVNSGRLNAQTITFKYLEAGHTFMSADTVHAGVERQMRGMNNVYDFNDFLTCVGKVPKAAILVPANEDFKSYVGEQSQPKLNKDRPLLAECRQLQFRKSSWSVWLKKSHIQEAFEEFDFMKKKSMKPMNPSLLRPQARGIPRGKKEDIITKLCPLMPENRREFWNELLTSEVPDLITHDD